MEEQKGPQDGPHTPLAEVAIDEPVIVAEPERAKRTTLDKVLAKPTVVSIAGLSISIHPLKGRAGLEWLAKAHKAIGGFSKLAHGALQSNGRGSTETAVGASMVVALADQVFEELLGVWDLVLEYAKADISADDLETIEENATIEEQCALAGAVFELGFPLRAAWEKISQALPRDAAEER